MSERRLPPVTEIPTVPGLFLDPVDMPIIGEEAPALATGPTSRGPVWDAALNGVIAEDGWIRESELSPRLAAVDELETDETTATGAVALAGLVVAIWGAREYRRRRSDFDRRGSSGTRREP